MAKFEFSSQVAELEICGKKYNVNVDNNTMELCKDIQKKAGELAKMANKDNNAVSDEDVCKFMLESIDKFLGEGSTTIIFMGRKKNYVDAGQLLNFILRELAAETVKDLKAIGEII